MIEDDHRHGIQTELLRGGETSMARHDHAIGPRQDRIGEPELDDGCRNLRHLLL